jgi:hypothetical protein
MDIHDEASSGFRNFAKAPQTVENFCRLYGGSSRINSEKIVQLLASLEKRTQMCGRMHGKKDGSAQQSVRTAVHIGPT